jgi:hypothetical protein
MESKASLTPSNTEAGISFRVLFSLSFSFFFFLAFFPLLFYFLFETDLESDAADALSNLARADNKYCTVKETVALTANTRYVLTLPPYRELPTPIALLQPIFDCTISLDHVYVYCLFVSLVYLVFA